MKNNYYECIKSYDFDFDVGKIYKDIDRPNWFTKYNNILHFKTNGKYFENWFKPSTKEAYEAQFKQYPLTPKECISNSDVIEIGDEVEVINDSNFNNGNKKIGDRFIVKLITKNNDSSHKYWIHYLDVRGFGIGDKNLKLIKKASQTTLNKKVDGISPIKVNTKLIDIIKIKGSTPTKVEKKKIKLTILKTKQLNLN